MLQPNLSNTTPSALVIAGRQKHYYNVAILLLLLLLLLAGLQCITKCNTTPSWLSTAVAAAHPNKTAPFLRARGTDGRFARHFQSSIYVDSRVTQGLEAPPRTSTSHLATDHGSRPPAAQSWSELSLATRSGPRTMEATCGNGYAPFRDMPAMMMMMTKCNTHYSKLYQWADVVL